MLPKGFDPLQLAKRRVAEPERDRIQRLHQTSVAQFRKDEMERLGSILMPFKEGYQRPERAALLAPLATRRHQVSRPPAALKAVPGECFLQFQMYPPYDLGIPRSPLALPRGAEAAGSSPYYKGSYSMASPADGDISVAVAVGTFYDTKWGAPEKWFLGDLRSTMATIIHKVDLPGPVDKPTSVEVTVCARIGRPDRPRPDNSVFLSHGAGGRVLAGLVGAEGWLHLSLFGSPSLETGRTASREFISEWETANGGASLPRQDAFAVSQTICLLPGAPDVTMVVSVEVWALKGMDEPTGGYEGYAAVDLRDPLVPGDDVTPWQAAGGPVRIHAVSMRFCRLGALA